jgi:hypothetical protein
MKYVLCAVLLTAFSATCYYGATMDSRNAAARQSADLTECKRLAVAAGIKLNELGQVGSITALSDDCDTVFKLGQ